jgi:hypothetical protein
MTTLIAIPSVERTSAPKSQRVSLTMTDTPGDSNKATSQSLAIGEATRIREEQRLENYRLRAIAFAPRPRNEHAIDEVLADSFPASDPPPWTLGVRARSTAAQLAGGKQRGIVAVPGAAIPGWRVGITSLFGASLVAGLFAVGILVIGSGISLAVHLVLKTLGVL